MTRYVITVGTVTYALKGRDSLRKAGKKAWVEKVSANGKNKGCGFAIVTEGDIESAVGILKSNGIRILEIN